MRFMELAFNKQTALAILRALRAQSAKRGYQAWTNDQDFGTPIASGGSYRRGLAYMGRRVALHAPDLSPATSWRCVALDLSPFGLDGLLADGRPVQIAVPAANMRIQSSSCRCTTYSPGLPELAFIEVGCGFAISSPELLFVELAQEMPLVEHLMLGHELCGTFSRDPINPYGADVAFQVQPVTSVESIRRFANDSKRIHGLAKARRTLELLRDNAWSPTESLVAAFACAPIDDFGYELGDYTLNPRFGTPDELRLTTAKDSRVPDILFGDTTVGINYDGQMHVDLRAIADAGIEAGSHLGDNGRYEALERVMADVRRKVVDDVRRNRELAADGLTVFPMVKEDLYEFGGLDGVIRQVLTVIERQTGCRYGRTHRALDSQDLCFDRQKLIRSFLPGGSRNVKVGRYLEGCRFAEGEPSTYVTFVEF